jgi:hypothetical protein
MLYGGVKRFKELLETVCDNVFHFEEAGKPEGNYIVYTETGKRYEPYDDVQTPFCWLMDVHVYTRMEYDPMIEALEKLFNANYIPFSLDTIQYGRSEGQTSVIYYLFKCEV